MNRFYLTALLFLSCVHLHAQIGAPVLIPTSLAGANELRTGDFNNDGKQDAIKILRTDSYERVQTIEIVMNQGGGSFSSTTIAMNDADDFLLHDFSGDGQADLIVGQDMEMQYLENLGGFVFDTPVIIDNAVVDPDNVGMEPWWWYTEFCAGDINNDGTPELVFAKMDFFGPFDVARPVLYYMSASNGNFGSPVLVGDAGTDDLQVRNIEVADIDHNGWNDISFMGPGPMLPRQGVYFASGPGLFLGEASILLEEIYDSNLCDMNSDGFMDILVVDAWNTSYIYNQDSFTLTVWDDTFFSPFVTGVDADLNGFNDLIEIHSSGDPMMIGYNYGNEMNITLTPFTPGLGAINGLDHIDADLDGDQDILVLSNGDLYYLPIGINIPATFDTFQITNYYDQNANGIFDSGDQLIPMSSVTITDVTLSQSNTSFLQSGSMNIELEAGDYSITSNYQNNNWQLNTTATLNFTSTATGASQTLGFGYVPVVNTTPELQVFVNSSSGWCNGPATNHFITVWNSGVTTAHGTFVYDLDAVHSYVSASVAPASVSGNTITWNYTDLLPGEYLTIAVEVLPAPSSAMGAQVTNTLTATNEDDTNAVIYTAIADDSYIVICSFDPNDITEANGLTEAGYILAGDQLDYTIRFQNTGNAAAQTVRIENQLPAGVTASTLQPVSWSHNFDLVLDASNKAIFTFSEINLPDSQSDETNSHGFVRFRIMSNANLNAGDLIESTAGIYFDYNEPVITNTELNTVYSCEDLEQATSSASVVCPGEEITFANNATWIEELTWTFNDVQVGTGDFNFMANENGIMWMHASNGLCDYEEMFDVTVFQPSATFTSNGNMLMANASSTYQWMLNGNEIAGATQQTYEISQTGNYSVQTTDASGCSATSASVQVTYTGITEWQHASISIYPNPVNDVLTIAIPNANVNDRITITDMCGKVVLSKNNLTGNLITMDCTELAPGFYHLSVGSTGKVFVKN